MSVLLEVEIQRKILTLTLLKLVTFIATSQRVPSLLILLTGGRSAVPYVPIFHCTPNMLKAARRLELHSKERTEQSVRQKQIGEILPPLNLLLPQLYIVLLPPEFYFMLTQLSASCPSCKKKNLKATD